MENSMEWYDKSILSYLKKHPRGKSPVDINSHFKMRADKTMESLSRLLKTNKVTKIYQGLSIIYWANK